MLGHCKTAAIVEGGLLGFVCNGGIPESYNTP
jgi:hypothetical protein